jgi:hypothetical protein
MLHREGFRKEIRVIWLVCLALAGCLSTWGMAADILREHYAFLIAAGGLCGLVATTKRLRPIAVTSRIALLIAAVPVALVLASMATGHEWSYPTMGVSATEACGLLVFLSAWELAEGFRLHLVLPQRFWSLSAPIVAIAAVALVTLIRASLFKKFALTIDQNLFLFQANWILHDPRGVRIPLALQPLLAIQQSYTHGGFLNAQYPPGWPATLALLRGVGLGHFGGALLTGSTVLGVILLGRRERSLAVGVSGAVLTLLAFQFLYLGATYLSEPLTCALAVYAALSLSSSSEATGVRRRALEVTAGLLLGLMFLTRPLTAVGVAGGLVVWRWSTSDRRLGPAITTVIAVMVGAIPGAVGMMWYNVTTTGSPFRFGYDLAHWGLQSLGFGMRGQVGYDAFGMMRPGAAMFGPGNAVYGVASMVVGTILTCQPVVLILGLLLAARFVKVRGRWAVLAPLAVLPAAYLFYFYHDPRFYIELVPFFMLITASFAAQLLRKEPRLALPLISLAVWAVVADCGQFSLEHSNAESRLAYFREIEATRRAEGRLLVFVDDPSGGWTRDSPEAPPDEVLTMLYWYDTASLDGDVVVVRDVRRLRRLAMACFPGRVPVVVSGGETARGEEVTSEPAVHELKRLDLSRAVCPDGWRPPRVGGS